jgi:hypothetical protein
MYPTIDGCRMIAKPRVAEYEIVYESQLPRFKYKVNVKGQTLVKRDIIGRDLSYCMRRIQTLYELSFCPFVIDLHGLVVDNSGTRLTGFLMPYMERGDLKDMLSKSAISSLPLSRRLKWGKQITIAISQLHKAGRVHGNPALKYILIDGEDNINLSGPGRNSILSSWQPPEAAGNWEKNFSEESDIFQLGMVLWCLASGKDEPLYVGVPLQITQDMGVPAWYQSIVESCLSDQPQLRPSASSLLDTWEYSEHIESNASITASTAGRARFRRSNLNVAALASAIQQPVEIGGVSFHDRQWHSRLHRGCFLGSEMATWLIENFDDLESREDAEALGNSLMAHGNGLEDSNINKDEGLFIHTEDRHPFRDGNYFYQISATFAKPREEWLGGDDLGEASESRSVGSSSNPSSIVEEDDPFETASIMSIATSISTNSVSLACVIKDATNSFADLLDESMGLSGAIQEALVEKPSNADSIRNGIRRLVKILSRDLSSESSMPEHRDVCKFLMGSSRQITNEIAKRAKIEVPVIAVTMPSQVAMDAPRREDMRMPQNVEITELFEPESEEEVEKVAPVSTTPTQISALRDVVKNSKAFQQFLASLNDLIYPTFQSRLKHMSRVAMDQAKNIDPEGSLAEVVGELLYSLPVNITLLESNPCSATDSFRHWLQDYTQQEWDWWPLKPMQPKPCSGTARLEWACRCGETRSATLPKEYARYIVKLRKETSNERSRASGRDSSTVTPSTNQSLAPGTAKSGSQMTYQAPQPGKLAGTYTPAPRMSVQNGSASPIPSQDLYVLFMVPAVGLRLVEIHSVAVCNEGLFKTMREEYNRAKGLFRSWFGLMVFSHCEFYKFEAWHKGRYCERSIGIPARDDQDYIYTPKPMDREPPISKHEFYDRFYKKILSEDCILQGTHNCHERDAVERIPQKKDLVSTTGVSRPQFYGIIAREKKSGIRMLVYICLSSIPGIIFFFLWLFKWGHDSLQDASSLLVVSFTLLGLLYAAQLL